MQDNYTAKDLHAMLNKMGQYGTVLFTEFLTIGSTYRMKHPTVTGHWIDITRLYGDTFKVKSGKD